MNAMRLNQWGPGWEQIEYVLSQMVPHLHAVRAASMKINRADPTRSAQARERAFKVAQDAGRIEQVINASEDLRRSAWDDVWTEHQSEAWEVSWALANLGIALATYDLIDPLYYTMDDYLTLIAPVIYAFPDMEIPR